MAQFVTLPLCVTHRESRSYLGGAILTSEAARPVYLFGPPASELGSLASEVGPPVFLPEPPISEAHLPPC